MSKSIPFKVNAELSVSVESKLFNSIKNAHAWYTNKHVAKGGLFALTAIDFIGFEQIASATMAESFWNRVLIVAAFIIAFEVAPLYIGYAMCLKSYGFGGRMQKRIYWLSLLPFILGILANAFYRWHTKDFAYDEPRLGIPMTFLMCILPIITSLVNIVMGCVSFNPLQYDIFKLTKKLRTLQLRKKQLESYNDSAEELKSLKEMSLTLEKESYDNALKEIKAEGERLKNFIKIHSCK